MTDAPPLFEELDYRPTAIGALSLRRRRDLRLGREVFEIMLGREFLMTSAFTASEEALAVEGLAACRGDGLSVAVGGLGLGYTARAALAEPRVSRLDVIEFLSPVIEWHETGLLPLGPGLAADPRCRFVEGDFFALAQGGTGLDPKAPDRRYDAILADIDHSPEALLDARSSGFYAIGGLTALSANLSPGGVFGLWSNDRPDARFTARLSGVFAEAWSVPVTFDNPLQDRPVTQTVYLARAAA